MPASSHIVNLTIDALAAPVEFKGVNMIEIGSSSYPPSLDPRMDRHPIMSVDDIEALFPCKHACRPAVVDHFPKEI
jgi:hypothetical protein